MSSRNITWLGGIAVAFILGWLVSGWIVGLISGVAVLLISEVIERSRRRRIAAEQGSEVPSVRRAVTSQRKRPGSRS